MRRPSRAIAGSAIALFSVALLATPLPVLGVASPPAVTNSFGAATIAVGGTTSLSFSVMNSNSFTLTGVSFTDNLPAGLVVATPNGFAGGCGGGTITAVSGTGSMSLTGGTIAASTACNFSINVTGTASGVKNNTPSGASSNETATGGANTAGITVMSPPTVSAPFGTSSMMVGASTTLTYTITNPNSSDALTGVGFTNTLPAGLVVAAPNGLTGSCGGGTVTATPGAGSTSLVGATVAASSSCTFSINVTGTGVGLKSNTVIPSAANGGTGSPDTHSITISAATAPTVTAHFGTSTLALGGSTSLTYTITNPNAGIALTGLGFDDILPAGLVVATPNGLTGSCGGGTITGAAGATSIHLAGATIAATATCTFSLNVTATSLGAKNNALLVFSNQGAVSDPAGDFITIGSPTQPTPTPASTATPPSATPPPTSTGDSGRSESQLPGALFALMAAFGLAAAALRRRSQVNPRT